MKDNAVDMDSKEISVDLDQFREGLSQIDEKIDTIRPKWRRYVKVWLIPIGLIYGAYSIYDGNYLLGALLIIIFLPDSENLKNLWK